MEAAIAVHGDTAALAVQQRTQRLASPRASGRSIFLNSTVSLRQSLPRAVGQRFVGTAQDSSWSTSSRSTSAM